jgi:hypothetical protein
MCLSLPAFGHETDFTLSDFAAESARAHSHRCSGDRNSECFRPARGYSVSLQKDSIFFSCRLTVDLRRRLNDHVIAVGDAFTRLAACAANRQKLDELMGRTGPGGYSTAFDDAIRCARRKPPSSSLNSICRDPARIRYRYRSVLARSCQCNQVQADDILDIRVADGMILSRVLSHTDEHLRGGSDERK